MEQQQTPEEQSLAILDQATATANLPRQMHFQVIGAIQCLKKLVDANKPEPDLRKPIKAPLPKP